MESSPGDTDPDVRTLFRHYDELYFRGALVDAAFTVEWTSPRIKTTTSGFGSCSFGKTSKTITLYQLMLRDRTSADLKNALLHLMIHAIIFVKHGMTHLSKHGPVFRDWMNAINTCSIDDYLRPKGGYCITTTHDFSQENLCSIQGNLWKCELCGITLLRATKLGPPSDSCCIENVSQHATCGNMLCHWHNHKMDCGGTYVVPSRGGQKMVPKGRLGLLSEPSEDTRKPIAASQSILKQQNKTNLSVKAGKLQHDPEDFRTTFFQPAVVSQRKLKQSNPAAPPKKEYACVSVWANIYESECSSGSAKPLVNKRTERRKRERERSAQITYSRSKKASGIKAQPAEEEISSQHTQLPSQCLDIPSRRMDTAAVPPADHQVMPQAPLGQSQPPAAARAIATHQAAQPHSADSPSTQLLKIKASSSHDVIDVSDDD